MPGPATSEAEVANISAHGFWLLVDGRELFLPFDEFPWLLAGHQVLRKEVAGNAPQFIGRHRCTSSPSRRPPLSGRDCANRVVHRRADRHSPVEARQLHHPPRVRVRAHHCDRAKPFPYATTDAEYRVDDGGSDKRNVAQVDDNRPPTTAQNRIDFRFERGQDGNAGLAM